METNCSFFEMIMAFVITFVIVYALWKIITMYCAHVDRKEKKAHDQLQKEYSRFIGMKGYYNTNGGTFVGEKKQPISGLEDFNFRVGICKGSIHPVFIPCKIKEFVDCGVNNIYIKLVPLVDDTFEFEVKYVSAINVAMYCDELGDIFMPIKDFWSCQVKDKVALKCEVCPWYYDSGKMSSELKYVNFVRA